MRLCFLGGWKQIIMKISWYFYSQIDKINTIKPKYL